MKRNYIISTLRSAIASFLVICSMFFVFEPAISFGSTNAAVTTTESLTVNKEVSFSTSPSNVTLSPSIGGITGGFATGATQFAILSNSTTGYNVTIFASSSGNMVGAASSSNSITAYKPASTNVPDYTYTVANTTGTAFGYTVAASSTSDLDQKFLTNGSNACNTAAGSDPALAHCWINASSSAVTIINRTMPTYTGAATATIAFKAGINANPNPIIPNDTYVATTTITVSAN